MHLESRTFRSGTSPWESEPSGMGKHLCLPNKFCSVTKECGLKKNPWFGRHSGEDRSVLLKKKVKSSLNGFKKWEKNPSLPVSQLTLVSQFAFKQTPQETKSYTTTFQTSSPKALKPSATFDKSEVCELLQGLNPAAVRKQESLTAGSW